MLPQPILLNTSQKLSYLLIVYTTLLDLYVTCRSVKLLICGLSSSCNGYLLTPGVAAVGVRSDGLASLKSGLWLDRILQAGCSGFVSTATE